MSKLTSIEHEIKSEYLRANEKHRPFFYSLHEARSIILEEYEEFSDEVRADNPKDARKELIQLAAMCIKGIMFIDSQEAV